ncbi:MAG: radical SAM protein [Xanthobacteraceae bacterium]|nr:radical SAM protein [Xanthobacteraceae bacterium]
MSDRIPAGTAPSAPRCPEAHLFDDGAGPALLNVDSGRIYPLQPHVAGALEQCLSTRDSERLRLMMTGLGFGGTARAAEPPPETVAVRTFSLAIAQKCNLGCTYCYAEQGSFGGDAKNMPAQTARDAVDRLLAGAASGQKIDLVFLGGEPLANRDTLMLVVEYATARASAAGIGVGFSLTTNATLLTASDIEFFERYGFSVTVSIDGIGPAHDRLRPFRSGRGSFDRVAERIRPLLSRASRGIRVTARVTVTPDNLCLADTLLGLADFGFDAIQFSPMLSSPSGRGKLDRGALDVMLQQMIECGRKFEEQIAEDRLLPFANVISTLRHIHGGGREAYPCGAGGSYMGVSADGDLYACHRFVGDERASMGNAETGVDPARQSAWLAARHVQQQLPCTGCWARNLCGGSCHYEAINAGREACDYIRGWLHYCLGAYVRLLKQRPSRLDELLGAPRPA